jgi:hypothetical protein
MSFCLSWLYDGVFQNYPNGTKLSQWSKKIPKVEKGQKINPQFLIQSSDVNVQILQNLTLTLSIFIL